MRQIAYKLQLFGAPQLVDATGKLFPIGKRARGILCYLSVTRDQKATRDRLCKLFWSDRGTPQALASLRQTLLQLRRAFPPEGPDPLRADRTSIALDPAHVSTDIEATEIAGSPAELLEMLRVIGNEPFADMPTFGAAFEEWRNAIRPHVEAKLRSAVLRQIAAAEAGGDHASIIALADAWAVRDPLDETVAAHAVRSEILTDARSAAERRFRTLVNRFEEEQGSRPDPRLFEILQNSKSDSPPADSDLMLAPAAKVTEAPAERPPGSLAQVKKWRAQTARSWRYRAALLGVVVLGAACSLAWGFMRTFAPAENPVIAVLPFIATNGDDDDAIFAEGLSEEVMNGLAEDERISVLGRATALRLSTTPDLRRAAYARLGVTRLVTGTLTYSSDESTIAVRVNLIDSRTGNVEWSRTVRLASTDVSSAEHELVDLVTREVLGKQTAQTTLPGSQAKLDAGAYRRIVLARRYILSRDGDRLIEARELARQAIAISPGWAEAHAVRSTAASLMQNYTDMPVEPLQAEASAEAAQAIALDPELSAAHEAQSFALEEVNSAQAMVAAKRAVELRPGNAEVRRRLAWLLRADGQLREAVVELENAIRIDPFWYLPYIDLGMSLSQMNQPGKMIGWQERHAALDPLTDERDLVLANMLLDTERAGEAAPVAARLVRSNPDFTYASLTWIDALLALYASDAIPGALFELNSSPAIVALSRGDVAGAAAEGLKQGPGVWSDPEGAVVLGYALMAQDQAQRLRSLQMVRYPKPDDYSRRPPQALALGRHPGLYPALAYAVAGDVAGAQAIRRKISEDVERLEQQGLAMSQSGITVAALALMEGNRSAALDRLESTMSAQWTAVCHGPIWIGSDPLFRELEREPRFEALRKRCRMRLDQQRVTAGLAPTSLR